MRRMASRTRRASLGTLVLLAVSVGASPVVAEVVDSAAGGFTSRNTAEIEAPPDRIWQALTRDVSNWWHPDHTFSGDSANLMLEARAQGCLCEKLEGHGSVRHMEIVFAQPHERLVMEGGLGPLQQTGASGAMSWVVSAGESGSTLELTYQVGGYHPGGLDGWAGAVDAVLADQLRRLGRYVETGKPE
jgi:uncharacterized protein YndB with AHSA1/START domain